MTSGRRTPRLLAAVAVTVSLLVAGCAGADNDATGGASSEPTLLPCLVSRDGDVNGVPWNVTSVGLTTTTDGPCVGADKLADHLATCLSAVIGPLEDPEARRQVEECITKATPTVAVAAGARGFGALFVTNTTVGFEPAGCSMQYDPRGDGFSVKEFFSNWLDSKRDDAGALDAIPDPNDMAKALVSTGATGVSVGAHSRVWERISLHNEVSEQDMKDVNAAKAVIDLAGKANEITADIPTDGTGVAKGLWDSIVDWFKGGGDKKQEVPPPSEGTENPDPDATNDCQAAQAFIAQCNSAKWATPGCKMFLEQLSGCDSTIRFTDGDTVCPPSEPTQAQIEQGLRTAQLLCWSRATPSDPEVNICNVHVPGVFSGYVTTTCNDTQAMPTQDDCDVKVPSPAEAAEALVGGKDQVTQALIRKAGGVPRNITPPRDPGPLPPAPGPK